MLVDRAIRACGLYQCDVKLSGTTYLRVGKGRGNGFCVVGRWVILPGKRKLTEEANIETKKQSPDLIGTVVDPCTS